MSPITDELQLIERMRDGNDSALEYFFHQYADDLYYRAWGFIQDTAAAEDIVQEVFIHFWQLRKDLHIKESVSSYLFKAVDNRCRDYIESRQARKYHERMFSAQEDIPVDEEEWAELRKLLKEFIDSLPEKCREIFLLACVEGMKYQQIAMQLNVSVNTVKTQLKSAYSKLRKEFTEKDRRMIMLLLLLHAL